MMGGDKDMKGTIEKKKLIQRHSTYLLIYD